MSDQKFPEIRAEDAISDLEVLKLRKEVQELRSKLQGYEKTLQENNLLDRPSQLSDEEVILTTQIGFFRELSDKGIPFTIEDVKCLEILVKTLVLARGKAPVVEEKPKKKEKPDIAKLLQIAGTKVKDE